MENNSVFEASDSGVEFGSAVDASLIKLAETLQTKTKQAPDKNFVQSLLVAGAETPLHLASKWPYDKVVDVLCASGADLDARNKKGRTALHTAALFCRRTVIERLIKAGSALNAVDTGLSTPLHLHLRPGNTADKDVIQLLVGFGAALDSEDAAGQTPFNLVPNPQTLTLYVVQEGLIGAMSQMIKCGINLDKMDADGLTPLHLATYVNNAEMTRCLFTAGARANVLTPNNLSAELSLSGYDSLKMSSKTRCLLKAGALVNVLTAKKLSADLSLSGYDSLKTSSKTRCLLKAGARVNVLTPKNLSADLSLSGYDSLKMSSKVLDGERSALHFAAECASTEVLEALIQSGARADIHLKADIHMKVKVNGMTPLHYAAFNTSGLPSIVALLISHGAKIEERTREGWTTLQLAAKVAPPEVVAELLKHGARVNAKGKQGKTALDCAKKRPEILAVLTGSPPLTNSAKLIGRSSSQTRLASGSSSKAVVRSENNSSAASSREPAALLKEASAPPRKAATSLKEPAASPKEPAASLKEAAASPRDAAASSKEAAASSREAAASLKEAAASSKEADPSASSATGTAVSSKSGKRLLSDAPPCDAPHCEAPPCDAPDCNAPAYNSSPSGSPPSFPCNTPPVKEAQGLEANEAEAPLQDERAPSHTQPSPSVDSKAQDSSAHLADRCDLSLKETLKAAAQPSPSALNSLMSSMHSTSGDFKHPPSSELCKCSLLGDKLCKDTQCDQPEGLFLSNKTRLLIHCTYNCNVSATIPEGCVDDHCPGFIYQVLACSGGDGSEEKPAQEPLVQNELYTMPMEMFTMLPASARMDGRTGFPWAVTDNDNSKPRAEAEVGGPASAHQAKPRAEVGGPASAHQAKPRAEFGGPASEHQAKPRAEVGGPANGNQAKPREEVGGPAIGNQAKPREAVGGPASEHQAKPRGGQDGEDRSRLTSKGMEDNEGGAGRGGAESGKAEPPALPNGGGAHVSKEGSQESAKESDMESAKVGKEGDKVSKEGSNGLAQVAKVAKEGDKVSKEGSKGLAQGAKVAKESAKESAKEGDKVGKEVGKGSAQGAGKVREMSKDGLKGQLQPDFLEELLADDGKSTLGKQGAGGKQKASKTKKGKKKKEKTKAATHAPSPQQTEAKEAKDGKQQWPPAGAPASASETEESEEEDECVPTIPSSSSFAVFSTPEADMLLQQEQQQEAPPPATSSMSSKAAAPSQKKQSPPAPQAVASNDKATTVGAAQEPQRKKQQSALQRSSPLALPAEQAGGVAPWQKDCSTGGLPVRGGKVAWGGAGMIRARSLQLETAGNETKTGPKAPISRNGPSGPGTWTLMGSGVAHPPPPHGVLFPAPNSTPAPPEPSQTVPPARRAPVQPPTAHTLATNQRMHPHAQPPIPPHMDPKAPPSPAQNAHPSSPPLSPTNPAQLNFSTVLASSGNNNSQGSAGAPAGPPPTGSQGWGSLPSVSLGLDPLASSFIHIDPQVALDHPPNLLDQQHLHLNPQVTIDPPPTPLDQQCLHLNPQAALNHAHNLLDQQHIHDQLEQLLDDTESRDAEKAAFPRISMFSQSGVWGAQSPGRSNSATSSMDQAASWHQQQQPPPKPLWRSPSQNQGFEARPDPWTACAGPTGGPLYDGEGWGQNPGHSMGPAWGDPPHQAAHAPHHVPPPPHGVPSHDGSFSNHHRCNKSPIPMYPAPPMHAGGGAGGPMHAGGGAGGAMYPGGGGGGGGYQHQHLHPQHSQWPHHAVPDWGQGPHRVNRIPMGHDIFPVPAPHAPVPDRAHPSQDVIQGVIQSLKLQPGCNHTQHLLLECNDIGFLAANTGMAQLWMQQNISSYGDVMAWRLLGQYGALAVTIKGTNSAANAAASLHGATMVMNPMSASLLTEFPTDQAIVTQAQQMAVRNSVGNDWMDTMAEIWKKLKVLPPSHIEPAAVLPDELH
eukprot:gene18690-25210_t